MAEHEPEVRGSVVRISYENPDTSYRVLVVERPTGESETLVGNFGPAPVGVEVVAKGQWVDDERYGRQLKVSEMRVQTPSSSEGLQRFLASGALKGIGPKMAEKILAEFGEETLKVLDESPEKLSKIRGISKQGAVDIGERWQELQGQRDAQIALQGFGLSPALATKIIKAFGPRSVDLLQTNPYGLIHQIHGIGFVKADEIARQFHLDPDGQTRLRAGLLHALTSATNDGHTFVRPGRLLSDAANLLGASQDLLRAQLREAILAGAIGGDRDEHRVPRLYPPELFAAETGLAEHTKRLLEGAKDSLDGVDEVLEEISKRGKVQLSDEQADALRAAAQGALTVITGGPGVGKTTMIFALLELYEKHELTIGLAAPTGRAAKRLAETTGREAKTLHRLLEVDPRSGRFQRNRHQPLDLDVVVVDEVSMVELLLAHSLFDALPDGCRVVLVGDVDQLPSVGPGAVLADLLAAEGVVSCRLTRIFRQSAESRIIEASHAVREGRLPVGCPGPGGDFFIIERRDGASAARTIVELVTQRIPQKWGFDPMKQVQVLSPMRRGEAGVEQLNLRLQEALNPDGAYVRRGNRVLRQGDRVMQLRNDYDKEVFNGDLGHIRHIDEKRRTLQVQMNGRQASYGEKELDQLVPAYAVSIHKSQGSEYPAVVIPWLREHYVMLSRHLLYTAMTRGKALVVLVADQRAIELALGETRKFSRLTALRPRLQAALASAGEDEGEDGRSGQGAPSA